MSLGIDRSDMSLHILDYLTFAGLCVGSGIIGVYFGWFKRSKTIDHYVVGDGTLVYPAIVSIIVTFTTPKHLFADPAEVVMFGTQFSFGALIGQILGGLIYLVFFLPVQVALKERSLLEYFERRHNVAVRMVAAVLMLIKEMTLLPILIYLTSLVMNELLGVPNAYSSTALVLLCLSYTCLGGVRAVMWTDTLQYGYLLVTVAVCLCVGIHQIGGVERIWRDGIDGDRIEIFNFPRALLYDRMNGFSVILNEILFAVSLGLTNQSFYQRVYCVKEKINPKRVVILSYLGNVLCRFGALATGLILYSYFKNCHPLLTNEINKPDKIMAHFILKLSQTIPGLLGLFSAGVAAAALSTMSTSLNTMACLFHDDLAMKISPKRLTTKSSFIIMKSAVIIIAIFALAATPLLDSVKSFQQAIVTSTALTGGAIMSLFLISMTNPWVNCKGLIAGAVAAVAVPTTLVICNQRLISERRLIYATKLITTYECNQTRFEGIIANMTESGYPGTGTVVFNNFDDPITWITSISYLWYTPISLFVSLIVSSLVTLCTGVRDVRTSDADLLCPQLRWIVRQQTPQRKKLNQEEDETIPLK